MELQETNHSKIFQKLKLEQTLLTFSPFPSEYGYL